MMDSISIELIFSPPEITISFERSLISTAPSGCLTARSPVQNTPFRKAFFVASESCTSVKGVSRVSNALPTYDIILLVSRFHHTQYSIFPLSSFRSPTPYLVIIFHNNIASNCDFANRNTVQRYLFAGL